MHLREPNLIFIITTVSNCIICQSRLKYKGNLYETTLYLANATSDSEEYVRQYISHARVLIEEEEPYLDFASINGAPPMRIRLILEQQKIPVVTTTLRTFERAPMTYALMYEESFNCTYPDPDGRLFSSLQAEFPDCGTAADDYRDLLNSCGLMEKFHNIPRLCLFIMDWLADNCMVFIPESCSFFKSISQVGGSFWLIFTVGERRGARVCKPLHSDIGETDIIIFRSVESWFPMTIYYVYSEAADDS